MKKLLLAVLFLITGFALLHSEDGAVPDGEEAEAETLETLVEITSVTPAVSDAKMIADADLEKLEAELNRTNEQLQKIAGVMDTLQKQMGENTQLTFLENRLELVQSKLAALPEKIQPVVVTQPSEKLWPVLSFIAAILALLGVFSLLLHHRKSANSEGTHRKALPATLDHTSLLDRLDQLETSIRSALENRTKDSLSPLTPADLERAIDSSIEKLPEMIRDFLQNNPIKTMEEPYTDQETAGDNAAKDLDAVMGEAAQSLLPEPYRRGCALEAWTTLLFSKTPESSRVGEVVASLCRLQSGMINPETTIDQGAEIVFHLSEKAYSWWNQLDPTDYPVVKSDCDEEISSVGDINAMWLRELKPLLQKRWPELLVHAFYPDSRWDPDLMVREDEFSGMRPSVSQPLSWAVAESGLNRQRVIFRARVVTH